MRFNGSDAEYLNNAEYNKYYREFANTPEEGLASIREKIWFLDYLFNTYAQVSSTPFIVWRGTNDNTMIDYSGLNLGFISTSTSSDVALDFGNDECCLYEYTVQSGVPFLSMKKYSKYAIEDEVLLPRGLTTTAGTDISKLSVTMTTPNQYRINYECTTRTVVGCR